MIVEFVQMDVKAGMEAAFEDAFRPALLLLAQSEGCESARIFRSIENPSRFRLVVQWRTLEDHTKLFRGTPAHQRIKEISGQYVEQSSGAEHHNLVLDAVSTA